MVTYYEFCYLPVNTHTLERTMDVPPPASPAPILPSSVACEAGNATEPQAPAGMTYPPIGELRSRVAQTAEASHAVSTKKTYACSWRGFLRFCDNYKLVALPAKIETVCLYLSFRVGRGLRNRSIRGDRSAIGFMHRRSEYADPTVDPRVTAQIMGHARTHVSTPNKKRDLTIEDIRGICRIFDETGGAIAIRNKAAMLNALSGALRSKELSELRNSDVTEEIHGLGLLVRRSKTDQQGAGIRKSIIAGKNPATDPVLALAEWRAVYRKILGREIRAEDPLFPALGRWGESENLDAALHRRNGRLTHMSTDNYRGWLKKVACAANPALSPHEIGGHSLRSAHATIAALNNAPRSAIAQAGPWKKAETMDEYIRPSRAATDSSSAFLGL